MKKLFTSLLTLSLFSAMIFAQDQTATIPCGLNHVQDQILHNDPVLKQQFEDYQNQFQSDYESFMQSYNPNSSDRQVYIVPVVVHIVHTGGPENIADQQVYDVIDLLNEDFNMANGDLSLVIPQFQGIIGDAQFEFRLATKDPNGNCHKGITRTFSTATIDNGNNAIVSAVSSVHGTWPQQKYLNIFVCKEITFGAAAYTNNPGVYTNPNSMNGGIICLYNYFGNTGTGTSRHTVSHEVGHWFNLSHVWGPNNDQGQSTSCSTDDGVSDTPNTIGTNGTCDLNQTTCSSLDNIQNIMDYSNCTRMFTQGQVARMITAINSSTSGRSNLWTASNLAATGVDVPSTDICQAEAAYTSLIICEGGTIDFADVSRHGVTSRNWAFAGGTPSTSTDSAVSVTFNTAGTYTVNLDVTSSTDVASTTYEVVVLPSTGTPLNYIEGFENLTTITDNNQFFVENADGGNQWQINSTVASDGNNCIKLQNFSVNNEGTDGFVSNTIDLSTLPFSEQLTMKFDYAYSKRSSSNQELLRVYGTINCGDSWSALAVFTSDDLSTNIKSTSFTPTDADWQTKQFVINPPYYKSNFRFKFEFKNDNGNNIYIDNINIIPTAQLGNAENKIEARISVYPNPSNANAVVTYYSPVADEVTVEVYNVMGKKVSTVYNGSVIDGNTKFNVETSDFAKGVYFIKINNTNGSKTIKLIKE